MLQATGAGVGSIRLMCLGLSPGFLATPTPTTAKNWKVWNGKLGDLQCGFSLDLVFWDFKVSVRVN